MVIRHFEAVITHITMKFAIVLLFSIVAAASASFGGGYYSNSARERKVNYVNGERQAYVNRLAEKVGASSGTYRENGVPGTGVGAHRAGYARVIGYPTGSYNYPGSKGYGNYKGYSTDYYGGGG